MLARIILRLRYCILLPRYCIYLPGHCTDFIYTPPTPIFSQTFLTKILHPISGSRPVLFCLFFAYSKLSLCHTLLFCCFNYQTLFYYSLLLFLCSSALLFPALLIAAILPAFYKSNSAFYFLFC